MTHFQGSIMRRSIEQYCAALGQDPLLIQGASGNVSWKEDQLLWIKASGTWLAEALLKDIFIPIDLSNLQYNITRQDYTALPKPIHQTHLRASIETHLHAIMPQRIVVHIHAVEVLAYLVRKNFKTELETKLKNTNLCWAAVDYFKPGACLAQNVQSTLNKMPNTNVLFLQNHGIVIGAESIAELDSILRHLLALFSLPRQYTVNSRTTTPDSLKMGGTIYHPTFGSDSQLLAIEPALFAKLDHHWALYPDQIVFLGAKAKQYASIEDAQKKLGAPHSLDADIIFVQDQGVFLSDNCNLAKKLQLYCYAEVLLRQPIDTVLNTLTTEQIAELLNWDAEQYRIDLANSQERNHK